MKLVITPGGVLSALYCEEIDYARLGKPKIVRASSVEPDGGGHWWADLGPVQGPVFGPFRKRGEALREEARWLETHLL